MPADQTRATLLAFVAAVRDDAPLEPHLAADATFTALATGRVIRGRAAVAAFIRDFYRGAFHARGQLNAALFDADDRLVLDLDLVGTHVGAFMGIPATGRRSACAAASPARPAAARSSPSPGACRWTSSWRSSAARRQWARPATRPREGLPVAYHHGAGVSRR